MRARECYNERRRPERLTLRRESTREEASPMLGRFRKLLSKSPEGEAAPPESPPEGSEVEATGPLVAPHLEFLSYGEILTFRTFHLLPLHTDFEAPFEFDEGRTENLVLRARTRLEQEDGSMEYTAEVTGSQEALAALDQRYGEHVLALGGRPERRAVRRIPHRIRVRSRHLPHFQGITHDLTVEGVRLIVDGEVAPDSVLDLDMQLDHDRLPNVKGQGIALWTAPSEGRSYWVGVRITSLEDAATLEEYLGEVGNATDDGLTRKNFL